ncbi:MAG: transporter [Spartobacteria bacterium]|nr:transporter [Spartobacteria bacterium]
MRPGDDVSEENDPGGLRSMVRAFRHRNFRLYFGGQSISLIGTWVQQIALGWTIYQLTHSSFLLGLVSFAGQLPLFLVTPFAGVLVDRFNRHRILILTQTLSMLQAFALALVVSTGTLHVWNLIVLNIIAGIILAVDLTARQAFIVEMVGAGRDLPNAVALNAFVINGGRMLGPAIAGVLLTLVTPAVCFYLNAVSYIPVIAALLFMRVSEFTPPPFPPSPLQELLEGVRYAFGFPPIRATLLLVALVSLLGMPYAVLMPIFAAEVLRGGPHTLGLLMTAPGIGALVGTIYLASRKTIVGAGVRIAAGAMIFSGGLITVGFAGDLIFALIGLVFVGLGMIVHLATSNTALQTIVDDDKRGRVMSLYTMAVMGMAPFGSLFGGALAHRIGVPTTFLLGGAICLGGSVFFATKIPALRPMVLPIYRRKGIIPQVAEGLQNASSLLRSERR